MNKYKTLIIKKKSINDSGFWPTNTQKLYYVCIDAKPISIQFNSINLHIIYICICICGEGCKISYIKNLTDFLSMMKISTKTKTKKQKCRTSFGLVRLMREIIVLKRMKQLKHLPSRRKIISNLCERKLQIETKMTQKY